MTVGIAVVFFGVFMTLASLYLALRGGGGRRRRQILDRAKGLEHRCRRSADGKGGGAHDAAQSVKRTEASSLPVLDRFVKRFVPRSSALRERLARSGYDIAPGYYLLAGGAVGLAAVLGATVLGLSAVVALLIGVGGAIGLPHLAVSYMIAGNLARFHDIFPDAIDLIVRGLKSGLPVTESICAVGREMADPVGREFRLVFDSVKFGRSLDEALWDTARRLDTPEFKFFVISLSVQQETGGNLAETLANLSAILRQRRQMKLKVKAMSAEAKVSAYILGSLPFIMFAIIYFINPGYETALFTDPRGHSMIGAGFVILSMGVAVMGKMVRFDI